MKQTLEPIEALAIAIDTLKKIAAFSLVGKDGTANPVAWIVRAGDQNISLAMKTLVILGITEFPVGEGVLYLQDSDAETEAIPSPTPPPH